MKMLWSGTDPETNRLLFRVYAAEIPDTERKLRTRLSHLTALDLLSAVLLRDFGIFRTAKGSLLQRSGAYRWGSMRKRRVRSERICSPESVRRRNAARC